METTLERLGSPPAMKNGNRLKVILLNSYFTRALNQLEENARQKSRSLRNVERKVASSSPAAAEVFLAVFLQSQ